MFLIKNLVDNSPAYLFSMKCIEKDNHMAEVVHPDMKAFFAGKDTA